MSDIEFDRLLERMMRSKIVSDSQLAGCSTEEITALEDRYHLRLPSSYVWYLRTMGHNSGRLFTSDHMKVSYADVLTMREDLHQKLASDRDRRYSAPPPTFQLPSDALLIASRLGEQFEFINCNGENDSTVWYFNNWDWMIQPSHPSVLAWLECWTAEAEQAIADGYFDQYPKGTTP